jgi:preprotein translocase subunit SecA
MEDNLMRIFGDPNRTKRLLQFAGMKEGEVIESGMLTRQIEKAQRKVESHNFDIRKQLLLFDDVANDQRKVIYQQRTEILGTADLSGSISDMLEEATSGLIDQFVVPEQRAGGLESGRYARGIRARFQCADGDLDVVQAERRTRGSPNCASACTETVHQEYEQKVERIGAPIMRHVERDVVLKTLDQHWREHLAAMEYLKQGIHLRGYAQKDYRFEFKREAFELFSAMLGRVKFDTVSVLTKIEVRTQEQVEREEAERRERMMRALQAQHAEIQPLADGWRTGSRNALPVIPPAPRSPSRRMRWIGAPPFVRSDRKVGRNEPCPCGSGKKFKHCHGALAGAE